MSLETEYNNLAPIMPYLGVWVLDRERKVIESNRTNPNDLL